MSILIVIAKIILGATIGYLYARIMWRGQMGGWRNFFRKTENLKPAS